MYSKRQLLLYCGATALVTALAGVAFVETAYPWVRGRLQTILLGRKLERTGDFRNPEGLKLARDRYSKLLREGNQTMDEKTVRDFVVGYANLNIWRDMFYLGIPIQKYPNDLAMFQQVVMEVEPDYVIETGTNAGGSALFFAHTLDGLGLKSSRVITLDLYDNTKDVAKKGLWRQYVEFVHASSTDPSAVKRIADKVRGKRVLVTLDSDHRAQHVSRELELYSPLVSAGSYLVVEDTLVDGIPLDPKAGPGPMSAMNQFLANGGETLFERDLTRDALILTQNRGGWLRRKTQ